MTRRVFFCFAAVLATGCGSDESSGDRAVSGTGSAIAPGGQPAAGMGGSSGAIAGGQVTQPTMPPPSTPPPGAPVDPEECSAVSESAEVELGPADIVWVIDGSPSMLDEIAAVQMNIATFATQISMAGIDHHVVMVAPTDVAGPTALGADPEHYRYVLAAVQSNNALQLLVDHYPQYVDFLRPEASLHFVVVTDDNSFMLHTDFKARMEGLAGKPFFFHSIASEDAPGPCAGACGLPIVCGAFAPGFEYYALSDLTGGEKISICTTDWSQVFGPLQDAVIESAPLPCNYPIPLPPDGESLDPSKVNMEYIAPEAPAPQVYPRADGEGACADNLAWYYDDAAAPTLINLCPAACDAAQAGGTVNIAFGCETVPLVLE